MDFAWEVDQNSLNFSFWETQMDVFRCVKSLMTHSAAHLNVSLHSCSCYCSPISLCSLLRKPKWIDSIYFDRTLFNIKKTYEFNRITAAAAAVLCFGGSGLIHNWSDNCIVLSMCMGTHLTNTKSDGQKYISISLSFSICFAIAGLSRM